MSSSSLAVSVALVHAVVVDELQCMVHSVSGFSATVVAAKVLASLFVSGRGMTNSSASKTEVLGLYAYYPHLRLRFL